ncbi:AraC family transcriptional regulator [Pseudonocardia sp. C8]|uniref:AraC family transcriptional regulator n=1 Tax=Pseudonocardia sp. C8 TaxID=2762759 RepID=UPI001643472C|nr:AraC family transcriptional regulator [Pseudonocardia sp. C8]MBC3191154.1 AraC family transcriptional regulator [Pseudonocardia sp. C8]
MRVTDPLLEVLDSRDLDEARAQVARSYCPHMITVRGRGTGFRARHAAADGPDVGVFRLGYGSEPVHIRAEEFRDFVLISRPLSGALTVSGTDGTTTAGRGEAVLLGPDDAHRLDFGPGCRLLTVKVSTRALCRVGAAGPGTGNRLVTGRSGAPAAWDAVTRFLLAEAVPHGLIADDSPLRRHVADLVASAAAASFTTVPAAAGGTAALDRALEFIDAHAHRDVDLAAVAAAAGVGPRSLQETFRQRLGTTPLTHLRNVRLDRVRAELRSGGRPVAEVAHDWGFGHLGRFAAAYRRRFGRLPSEDRRPG